MGVKQIEIKNLTYYFYDDMINLKDFESNLLKANKKNYKGMNIYYIGYITIKKMTTVKIFTVKILYICLLITQGDISKNSGNKYLIFDDFIDENIEVLKKYTNVWNGIKHKLKAINGGEENHYEKDYMKIKFNSDDDLSLNKPLKFHAMTIIIRSVFEEDGKLYPQLFLDDTLYRL